MPQLYFESIETLTQRIDLLSRIRFLLQDVLDLKKNSWHRRIQPEIPKTFEQIEQEIREEENKIKLALAIYPRKPKDNKNAIYRNNNSSSKFCDLFCNFSRNYSYFLRTYCNERRDQ